jgi:hypothetical protein
MWAFQPKQHATEGGLAGPGFAYDSKDFAFAHLQVNAIHGTDDGCPLAEQATGRTILLNKALGLQQGRPHARTSSLVTRGDTVLTTG